MCDVATGEGVAHLVAESTLRGALRAGLKAIPDLPRALSRLALRRGGPRDLAALRDGLAAARGLGATLRDAGGSALPRELASATAGIAGCDPALEQALADALADELPLLARDGGFVRAGYEPP